MIRKRKREKESKRKERKDGEVNIKKRMKKQKDIKHMNGIS